MKTATRPIPGTDAYWRDRRQGFADIAELEKAIEQRSRAPLYFAGSKYAEDTDDVIENTAPFERVCDLQEMARANATVVEILNAQGRSGLLTA